MSEPRPSARTEEQEWLVLYDGECGFCKWMLAGLLRWDQAERLQPLALQSARSADLLADLEPSERMASWHLVDPAGRRLSGGAAIAPLLRQLPGGRPLAACFQRFPGLTSRGYAWSARNRSRLSRPVPSASKRRASASVSRREGAWASTRDAP